MQRAKRYIAICCFCCVAAAGCSSETGDKVVVILRTKSYHTAECPRVFMANTKLMTIGEARAMECKPCKGCKPGEK